MSRQNEKSISFVGSLEKVYKKSQKSTMNLSLALKKEKKRYRVPRLGCFLLK